MASTPDAPEGPEHGRRRRYAATVRSVLSHPLILIGVGAVVSGILVPILTSGAQEHRQALEIKSDLVSSMSAAASPFLAATQATVLAHNGEAPPSYDAAYQEWVADSNAVWTKLRTYFPDADATSAWSSFMLRMRDVYYIFGVSKSEGGSTREEYQRRLSDYISSLGRHLQQPHFLVDFDLIDEWLSKPERRFDGGVNYVVEELFFALRTAMVRIQGLTLEATPRL